MMGWSVSAIIQFVYPPVRALIGSYSILPIPICGLIVTIVLMIYLPETKGKTVIINKFY
jgi:hypothetical protein